MTISLEMREDVAVFRYPSEYGGMVEELDDLLERRDAGKLSEARFVGALEDLVARNPWFIDGHAHLGYALYHRGKFELALECCERGFSLGTELLPADFREFIEWGYLDNRPFLRAAHGVVLCNLRLGRAQEAIAIMEKMLAWNPGDNQGIRYIIGSEYLRAGKEDEAKSFFETEVTHYPPYRYELGLLLLRQGRHMAAATSLRHGFIDNGYIAEVLCGNPDPLPVGVWHGSNLAEPELAKEYASCYGSLWHGTPDAVAFSTMASFPSEGDVRTCRHTRLERGSSLGARYRTTPSNPETAEGCIGTDRRRIVERDCGGPHGPEWPYRLSLAAFVNYCRRLSRWPVEKKTIQETAIRARFPAEAPSRSDPQMEHLKWILTDGAPPMEEAQVCQSFECTFSQARSLRCTAGSAWESIENHFGHTEGNCRHCGNEAYSSGVYPFRCAVTATGSAVVEARVGGDSKTRGKPWTSGASRARCYHRTTEPSLRCIGSVRPWNRPSGR